MDWIIRFLDMLLRFFEYLHSKRVRYALVGIGVWSLEAYLAFRAATVAFVFFTKLGGAGAEAAMPTSVFVFVATALTGGMLASHPSEAKEIKLWGIPWLLIAIIAADCTGIVYLAYVNFVLTTVTANITQAVITASLCILTVVPFGLGTIMETIHKEIPAERDLMHEVHVQTFLHVMESLAMAYLKKKASKDNAILAQHLPKQLAQYTSVVNNGKDEHYQYAPLPQAPAPRQTYVPPTPHQYPTATRFAPQAVHVEEIEDHFDETGQEQNNDEGNVTPFYQGKTMY